MGGGGGDACLVPISSFYKDTSPIGLRSNLVKSQSSTKTISKEITFINTKSQDVNIL